LGLLFFPGKWNKVFSSRMSKKKKNVNAVALGRLGGLKGGQARAHKLTPEERSESARKASQARWARVKGKSKNL
jgi:hypothetical protein